MQAICQECCEPLMECGSRAASKHSQKKITPSKVRASLADREVEGELDSLDLAPDCCKSAAGLEGGVGGIASSKVRNSLHYWTGGGKTRQSLA
jgi:hypothetical protein